MKNKEIFKLLDVLNGLKSLSGIKFNYIIAKNIKQLESEIDTISKLYSSDQRYQEFENNRIKLCEQYSEKYENGTSKIENNSYVIPNREEFENELNKLKETYSDAISNNEILIQDYNNFLESEIDFTLFKIKEADLPSNMTVDQCYNIMAIIED